jgi:cytochrome P450
MNGMTDQQPTILSPTSSDEVADYPFPFDHSMTCPAGYTHARETGPVVKVHMPFGGDAYLVTSYTETIKAFSNPQCAMIQYSDGKLPRMEEGDIIGASAQDEGGLFNVSDARHHQIRRLVTRVFTVQHAQSLIPRVTEVTNELLDSLIAKGAPGDLYEDYAIQTPMAVISEMVGVTRQNEHLFREWGRSIVSIALTPEQKGALWHQMAGYIAPQLQQAQENPGNNVLGLLIKAREKGDEVLSQQEMFQLIMGLIGAGFETVSTSFTNQALLLFQHRDLLEQLRERVDDPVRMGRAIEELLRVTPLGHARPRITRAEVKMGNTTIAPGEVILLSPNGANFDETFIPHPEVIDFDREANPMITFGRGIHACLGQQLARMELQVLWTTLLTRLPNVRLAVPPAEVPFRPAVSVTIGPAHLPVTW